MSETTEAGDVFRLRNDEDAARVCIDELQPWLRRHAGERYGFSEARLRQLWVVVWEALQNAIKYGSRPGEEVEVRVAPAELPGHLQVELTQPRAWDWPSSLGIPRKMEVDAGQFLMGGTVMMLWLADAVRVEERGRRILLHFSPNVKDKRRVQLPSNLSTARKGAAG